MNLINILKEIKMPLSIYKVAYRALMGWSGKDMEDAFELLESDNVVCQLPNYGGWLMLEVDLEDANWVGERNTAIETMLELKLIDEEEATELYLKEEIKQIIFAI
jgi:hypothetical protein